MPGPSEPGAREQLLQIQRASYARLEEELRARRPRHESKEARAYRRRYEREVSAFRKVSDKAALIRDVTASSIVYCGDFHTLRQAQRTPIRILRSVVKKRPNVVLALELLARNHERVAQAYLEGQLDDATFRNFISYEERWGFPWGNYRQLFDFAREHRLRIAGLNAETGDRVPLEARDDLAADFIMDATLSEPHALLFCLYGDLHVAQAHIPRKVDLRLKKHGLRRKSLVIFQNGESIYWELAERGLADKVDVVQISPRKYCVLGAAPWIKWQSYISWLDDQSPLLADPGEEETVDLIIPDYYHQVLGLAQQVGQVFGLSPGDLEQFSVLTADDTAIVDALKKYCTACRQREVPVEEIIRVELVENRSAYFPEPSVLYLSDLSENRAAEKAAQLLAAKLGPGKWLYPPGLDRKEAFYRLLLWEAIGFMGSKIVNPKRKCDQYRDFERFLLSSRGQKLREHFLDRRIVASEVLAHRAYETRRLRTGSGGGAPRRLYSLAPRRFFLAASALGQILAERLYLEMVGDRLAIGDVARLFSPLEEPGPAAASRYWELARMAAADGADRSSKEDRF